LRGRWQMLDHRVAEGDIELPISKRHGCGVALHEHDVGWGLRLSREQIKGNDTVLVIEPSERAAFTRPYIHDAVLGEKSAQGHKLCVPALAPPYDEWALDKPASGMREQHGRALHGVAGYAIRCRPATADTRRRGFGYAASATARALASAQDSLARIVRSGVKPDALDPAHTQGQERPFVLEASELALDRATAAVGTPMRAEPQSRTTTGLASFARPS
jgi:hypothetical protein